MRNPDAPYLELSFYFHNQSGKDSFRKFVKAFSYVYRFQPIEAVVHHSTSEYLKRSVDHYEHLVRLTSLSQMTQLLDDPSSFAKKITIENGSMIVPDAREFLVILPRPDCGCSCKSNVVAVWAEGEAFSRPVAKSDSSKERTTTENALRTFKELIARLLPSYATITVDYGLETPCDLKADSRTLAFRDFYLSRSDFGDAFLQDVRTKYPWGVNEILGDGQLTVTTAQFLAAFGRDVHVNCSSFELSQYVGKSIANWCID